MKLCAISRSSQINQLLKQHTRTKTQKGSYSNKLFHRSQYHHDNQVKENSDVFMFTSCSTLETETWDHSK